MFKIAKPRWARVEGWRVLSVLLACWLFGCVAFQYHPRTPYGVQCPTAPVQKITVAVRDCCARITGYEQVAPKPGDRAFVQCQCSEKKAAEHLATTTPKLDPYVTEPLLLEPHVPLAEPRAHFVYSERYVSASSDPSLRPPAVA